MKVKSALFALALATASLMSHGGEPASQPLPTEPPATPSGGASPTGITAGGVIGLATVLAVTALAIASNNEQDVTSTTSTATGTF